VASARKKNPAQYTFSTDKPPLEKQVRKRKKKTRKNFQFSHTHDQSINQPKKPKNSNLINQSTGKPVEKLKKSVI